MYTNITSGSNMMGVLLYNKQKIDEGHARLLGMNQMLGGHDPEHFDLSKCLDSFTPYLQANHNTKKPVIHISLNPDPRDQLTDEQLRRIADEYMERMGYGNQPYIIVKHEDIDRVHIHIVSVRVDERGRKLDHDYEARRSSAILRKLEKKYGLHPLEKGKQQPRAELKKLEYGKGETKGQIASIVRAALDQYRVGSMTELNALLNMYNVRVEEVKGEAEGKSYEGIIYYTLNDRGEVQGQPIKSSRIGKDVGPEAIRAKLEADTPTVKDPDQRRRTGERLRAAMLESRNKTELAAALQARNITAIFRETAQGRIYGATFVDHTDRVVMNGSRIGKLFSANAFQTLFSGSPAERNKLLRELSVIPETPKHRQTERPALTYRPGDDQPGQNTVGGQLLDVLLGDRAESEEQAEQRQADALRRRLRRGRRIRH